ncbi:uncharacterized protein LOC135434110 [Drosophila montana]|uniref:uncharacterized protein LOC135434110 n=1 Tax=Drosophila montana TaxID=40370 RepID=UPI00313E16F3
MDVKMKAETKRAPQIVWDEENTVKLIKAYEAQNVLWNPENRGFMHRNARYDAWKAMANVMQTSVEDVKRKMNSLIAVFRSQYRKGVANPRWWASHMSFLLNPGKADKKDCQPKLDIKSSTCDNSENSDNSLSNDLDGSDREFILAEPIKRPYQSAFQEFRAEFEPPKRLIIVEDGASIGNAIHLNTNPQPNPQPYLHPHPHPQPNDDRQPSGAESPTGPDAHSDDDDIKLYAKYLECKLKKYSTHTRNAIQFEFNRILYEADLGLHDKTTSNNNNSSSFA